MEGVICKYIKSKGLFVEFENLENKVHNSSNLNKDKSTFYVHNIYTKFQFRL